MRHIKSKYADLPDEYYGGESERYCTPDLFKASLSKGEDYDLWEWCAGSASLSKVALEEKVRHLPPVDYRYGWDVGRTQDQLVLLEGLLSNTIAELMASPTCGPWGAHTRGLPADQLAAKRKLETDTLEFVAVCCILQHLRGLSYLLENSAFSDIFTKSPLAVLRKLPYELARLD